MIFLKKKIRAETEDRAEIKQEGITLDDLLLRAIVDKTTISREEANEVSAVRACINAIANIIITTTVKLYERTEEGTHEVLNDNRVFLINKQTGDTLNVADFWKAIINDYFLDKGGYVYVERSSRFEVKSLRYVRAENVSFSYSPDPIFKSYSIYVDGKRYEEYEFMTFLRNSRNGYSGESIGQENGLLLSVVYNSLKYENAIVVKGGNKKGFLQSVKKLSQETMDRLKAGFKRLYMNNEENVIVLNDGITFQESSNTSAEMQINENKEINNKLIHELFGVPVAITEGKYTNQEMDNFTQNAILPLMKVIETELNRVLLTEEEKKKCFFAFDTTDLLKGNIKERYEAYSTAIDKNFLQVDEVREKENLKPLGFNFIKLGLQDVLYDLKTQTIYTPNTNQTQILSEEKIKQNEDLKKEGEENENRD